MSKQSVAKEKQRYVPKQVISNCCRTCSHLVAKPRIKYGGWMDENLFCGIGGFAVNATAICREFKEK
jgi:hypothetical protein